MERTFKAFKFLRWFARGAIDGWPRVAHWCLAITERRDARRCDPDRHEIADQTMAYPTAPVCVPGRQMLTRHANRLALWHTGFVAVPHVVAAVAIEQRLGWGWWIVLVPLVVGTVVHGWRLEPWPVQQKESPAVSVLVEPAALPDPVPVPATVTDEPVTVLRRVVRHG